MTTPNTKQPDQERIRTRYDFMAKWHDVAGAFVTPHRQDAIHALKSQTGDRILDLACGTGINFKRIEDACASVAEQTKPPTSCATVFVLNAEQYKQV